MASVDVTPLLKISNTETLTEFLHRCVDDLISGNKVDFDSYTSDVEWTRADFERARNLIQNLYQTGAKEGLEFTIIEGAPREVQTALENCYNVRKEQIYQAAVRKSMLDSGVENLVENFDWKVKWVMGSSKMASLREPFLQMSLYCVGKKCVDFEMKIDKVETLINELEKLKSEIKLEK